MDLSGLLRRVVDFVVPDVEGKGISLQLNCEPELAVMVDESRMTQVFLNLLVNAVRYTPQGGRIVVQARRTKGMDGTELVEVSIADSGIGIEPEHLPHVFDRFYRTDGARTRERGGAGLGLAIAKELVLAHQGTIEVDSSPGRGTVFTVKLPLVEGGVVGAGG